MTLLQPLVFPKRVLLIDDDEDDCYIFNSVINTMGNGIEFSYDRDSERALKSLSNEQQPVPDLLFLDWNMPRVSGSVFLQTMRSLPQLATVPVVIYTTSTAPFDREEA